MRDLIKLYRCIFLAAGLLLWLLMAAGCAEAKASEPASQTPELSSASETEAPVLEQEEVQAESVTDEEDLVTVTSAETGTEMPVPRCYEDEIVTDTPIVFDIQTTHEVLTYDSVPFAFYDFSNSDTDGLVWAIHIRSLAEQEASTQKDLDAAVYIINQVPLGYVGDTVYTLLYLAPEFPDTHKQYDPESYERTQSYYQHLKDGFSMLEEFVAPNGLERRAN